MSKKIAAIELGEGGGDQSDASKEKIAAVSGENDLDAKPVPVSAGSDAEAKTDVSDSTHPEAKTVNAPEAKTPDRLETEIERDVTVENSFNQELPEAKPKYILEGGIHFEEPQRRMSHFIADEKALDNEYLPIRKLFKTGEGFIKRGELHETSSEKDLQSKKEKGKYKGQVVYKHNKCPDGTHSPRRRRSFRLSRNQVGLYSSTSELFLFTSGFHNEDALDTKGFSDKDIKKIGGEAQALDFSDGSYVLKEIPQGVDMALLLDSNGEPVFFGHNCQGDMISVDECHLFYAGSEGRERGYTIFRLRRNCVALFQPDNINERPVLFKKEGIYILSPVEKGRLTVKDLNNPVYKESDSNDLKFLVLAAGERAFYYSEDNLHRQFKDSGGGVQVPQKQIMTQVDRVGIHLLYGSGFHFYLDKATNRPKIYPVESATISFDIDDFYRLVRLEIPEDETLYYVQSYGDCRVVRLGGRSTIDIEAFRKLPIRTDLPHLLRLREGVSYINTKENVCKELISGDCEALEKFDRLIHPSERSRNLSDTELTKIENILRPHEPIHKKAGLDFFEGKCEKELFYDTTQVTLTFQSKSCTHDAARVELGQFSVLNIPFNSFAVVQLRVPASLIHLGESVGGESYDQKSALSVYNGGLLLLNKRIESLVGIWPITEIVAEIDFKQRTKDSHWLSIKGSIRYHIVDGVKAVVPYIIGKYQKIDLPAVLDGVLDAQVQQIVYSLIGSYIKAYTLKEISRELMPLLNRRVAEQANDEFMNRMRKSRAEGYIRQKVSADGDCGYTAFGITRKKALSILLENFDKVKGLLKPVIREALLTDRFYQYLIANNIIESDLTHEAIIQNSEEHLSVTAIYRSYLTYDIREKQIDAGYAHPAVLRALSHIRGRALRIWRLGENAELKPNRGASGDYFEYIPPDLEDLSPIDILFINNNHFELLESSDPNRMLSEGDMPASYPQNTSWTQDDDESDYDSIDSANEKHDKFANLKSALEESNLLTKRLGSLIEEKCKSHGLSTSGLIFSIEFADKKLRETMDTHIRDFYKADSIEYLSERDANIKANKLRETLREVWKFNITVLQGVCEHFTEPSLRQAIASSLIGSTNKFLGLNTDQVFGSNTFEITQGVFSSRPSDSSKPAGGNNPPNSQPGSGGGTTSKGMPPNPADYNKQPPVVETSPMGAK